MVIAMHRLRRLASRLPRVAIMMLAGTALVAAISTAAARLGANPPPPGPAPQPSPAAAVPATFVLEPPHGPEITADPTAAPAAVPDEGEGAIEPLAEEAAPPPERRVEASGRFAMPLDAWTMPTDRYGAPRGRGLVHGGIDLALDSYPESPVFAACAGTVDYTGYSGGYGNHVTVDCGDGWSTLYGHLSSIRVSVGEAVDFQSAVGISGSTGFSTGEHLHFEIRWKGAAVNPEDYLDFKIPPGTPLSSGPIWFPGYVNPDPRPRPPIVRPVPTPTPRPTTAPSSNIRSGGDPGTDGGADRTDRTQATPTPRPAATPTPLPPTPTPRPAATPTPTPRPPSPTPTKAPALR
jgi:hypothetical protein